MEQIMVYVELALAVIAALVAVVKAVKACALLVKNKELFPELLNLICEAERKGGTGQEKLNYVQLHLQDFASSRRIPLNLAEAVELIENVISVTKQVNK